MARAPAKKLEKPGKGPKEPGRKPRDPESSLRIGGRLALDLDRHIPVLLVFLSNKFTNGTSQIYRRHFGVGVIEWRCMALLIVEPWISPNRICQVIGLDKAAVSRAIRTLEESGLVRVRSNSQRSRFLEVALTEKGAALHDRIVQVAFERERRLTADLGPEEREVLIRALKKMLARIDSVNGPIVIPPEN
ncbi:MarR family winged helix-turn-helix transcriptional regulator [Bradyrhizobium mercantei]|uniref:MarR family winged helix-turn-helix transcriptional regulator n=1 Tax=Bradyrhizobium mercantei TaxID=1904807 RepID=UPI000978845E|nr:MarR family transcriptional regulator [Bradyrhizobium mercantei]